MIKILIADDQAMVRQGFGALLAAQHDMLVVGDAADGAAAVTQSRELRPDVVLMDVRMPVMDGLEATRRLNHHDGPKVLILTTFDLDDYVYAALRAGASGFLLKDAPAADLINAVRIVAAGEALLAPSVTRRLIAEFAARPVADRPRPAALNALTPRETDVLRLVGNGLTNAQIADRLTLSEGTVKGHLKHAMAKLQLSSRAQAVVVAYESGLVVPRSNTPSRGRTPR